MDFANLAISKAVTDQNVTPFLEHKITPAMVPDMESRAVVQYLLDFHAQHRKVPSPQLLIQQFPTYSLSYAPDPCAFYVGKIAEGYATTRLIDTFLSEGPKLQRESPFDVAARLRAVAMQLQGLQGRARELRIEDDVSDRWDFYQKRKTNVGLIGIPSGSDALDAMTQGWQPEMYCGLAARPGTGKTWKMLRWALAAYQAGYDVLFCNKELSTDMMARRLDALMFALDYERLRQGMLTTAEELDYQQGLANLAATMPASWTWLHGAQTVSEIWAKVEELRPAIVFVDGAYLLQDEDGGRQPWEKYTNISRGLKRISQIEKVPLNISIQLNRGGDTKKSKGAKITQSDVAFSDSFIQDVDMLIVLDQTDDQRDNGEMVNQPLKMREAKIVPFLTKLVDGSMREKDAGSVASTRNTDDDDDDVVEFD